MTELPINGHVELIDKFAELYPRSPAGARGWIRSRRLDEYGPLLYIEWDKAHWRYRGEPDGWAAEAHFRLVQDEPIHRLVHEEALTEEPDSEEDPLCEHCGERHPPGTIDEAYLEMLIRAQQSAMDGEAFLILTVNAHEADGELLALEPKVYTAAKSEISSDIIEMKLVELASHVLKYKARDYLKEQ